MLKSCIEFFSKFSYSCCCDTATRSHEGWERKSSRFFCGRLQRTARRYCNGVEVGACPNEAQKKRLK